MIKEIQEFFIQNGYEWLEDQPIISPNNTLFFAISGGVFFQEELSKLKQPIHTKIASLQTCIRTDGWDKIGSTGRHHFAFSMLGHFMLYGMNSQATKENAIHTAWSLLDKVCKINASLITATAHPNDSVSQSIWKNLGVPYKLDNNVTHTDYMNPSLQGYRTEILVNDREIWNIVFTETQDSITMPTIAMDSGMSYDRLLSIVEGADSNYANSNWQGYFSLIRKSHNTDVAFKTLEYRFCELSKAIAILLHANVIPGPKKHEYILRKLIREALCIGYDKTFALNLQDCIKVASEYWLRTNVPLDNILQETTKWNKTITQGIKEVEKLLQKNILITEDHMIHIETTYGLPKTMRYLYEKR